MGNIWLQQAYLNIAGKLPTTPDIKSRLDRAYEIVRSNGSGYTITAYVTDHSSILRYRVHRASTQLLENNEAVYDTSTADCTCPDYPKARGGMCKHRLAVMILEEISRLEGCV